MFAIYVYKFKANEEQNYLHTEMPGQIIVLIFQARLLHSRYIHAAILTKTK